MKTIILSLFALCLCTAAWAHPEPSTVVASKAKAKTLAPEAIQKAHKAIEGVWVPDFTSARAHPEFKKLKGKELKETLEQFAQAEKNFVLTFAPKKFSMLVAGTATEGTWQVKDLLKNVFLVHAKIMVKGEERTKSFKLVINGDTMAFGPSNTKKGAKPLNLRRR